MDKYIILHRDGVFLEIRIEFNDYIIFKRRFMGYSRREAEKNRPGRNTAN